VGRWQGEHLEHPLLSEGVAPDLSWRGDSHAARAILLGATTPMNRQASDNQTGIAVAQGTAPFFAAVTQARARARTIAAGTPG